MALTLKAFVVWLAILACAVANGAVRAAILVPQLGKVPGMIVSGAVLCILILAITYATLPWLGARRPSQLLAIGAGWVAITHVFEFSLGRYQGRSWSSMLEVFTFKDGNVWPIVVLVTLLAPWIAARLRGLA